MSKKLTIEEFIAKSNKVHQFKYDYSESVYNGCQKKLTIICPKHGKFLQTPLKHMQGQGCPECAKLVNKVKHMKNLEFYIPKLKMIHNSKYSYPNIEYNGTKKPIEIICPIHGKFTQTVENHLEGKGCPKCGHTYTKQENEIIKLLEKNKIPYVLHDKSVLNGLELDILIPSKNIGIEFNGLRWHSELYKDDKNYHLSKLEECNKKGISLIQIFEDEWFFHKDIVINKILHLLNAMVLPKIMARKTEIKEISNSTSKAFLEKYHIQGFSKSTIYLGAFYDNKLIGVMTFKKTKKCYELNRFATDYNYICQGIGGKLFSFFVKKYNPSEVISFADRRWTLNGENNLYTKLNFSLINILKPDYKYYMPNENSKMRYHKFNFRKDRIAKKYNLNPKLTERELTSMINAYRIWDCGLFKYVYKKK